MEKTSNLLPKVNEQIKKRANKNKGLEYNYLWVSVSFALSRGGYMRGIGARAFGVFFVIRTYMNSKTKIAHPSLKTIAKDSGLCINTVKKDIAILATNGWIKRTVNRNTNGKFKNSQYLILETNLVRGTGDKSFMSDPVSHINSGKEPEPLSPNHNGVVTNKNNYL